MTSCIENFVKSLTEQQVPKEIAERNSTDKYVRINTFTVKGSIYLEEDVFNTEFMRMLDQRINVEKNDSCDKYFHYQILNAKNILYLDGDWSEEMESEDAVDTKKLRKKCAEKAAFDKDLVFEELTRMNITIEHCFIFTPASFKMHEGSVKMGYHAFIVCEDDVDEESRIRVYDYVKNNAGDMFVMDMGPLKNCQCLLPFATKPDAKRNYKLSSTGLIFNEKSTHFVNASLQRFSDRHISEQVLAEIDSFALYGDDEEDSADDDLDEEILSKIRRCIVETTKNFSEENWMGRYGKENKMIFEFMNSLKYLNSGHIFWQYLANHDTRLRAIIAPFMKIVYLNYFVHTKGLLTMDVGTMSNLVYRVFKPLLDKTVKKGEKTDRNTEESIKNHAANWFMKYGINGRFDSVKSIYAESVSQCCIDEANRNKWINNCMDRYRKNDLTLYKYFNKAGRVLYKYQEYNQGEMMEISPDRDFYEMTIKASKVRRARIEELQDICRKFMASWYEFVNDIVLNGITREIEPFGEKHTEILSTWFNMFMFVGCYAAGQQNDAIRSIVSAFTQRYIWHTTGRNGSTFVYNFKQTPRLHTYPYNQWIEDKETVHVDEWIGTIYDRYIKKLLSNTYRPMNLDILLNMLCKVYIMDTIDKKKIKPFKNISPEIRLVRENVFSSFNELEKPQELHPAKCDYFPMRNGWLHWISDANGNLTGEYEFIKDTYDLYMGAYTQVTWEDDYDYDSEEYKIVQRVVNQIYPEEDGREYCLSLFSSVLYGSGLKDKFLVMYGTGSDGKTTMINALQAMLGQEGFASEASVIENRKKIVLNCDLKGLASNMKAEALLVGGLKSSHDEGGIVEAMRVRLCSTQEPKLNTRNNKLELDAEPIKDITSGTATSARKIYQAAKKDTVNALTVMQTNHLPYLNDTTDGLKRRFTIYHHQSKFTADEGCNFENMKYHYNADAAVARNLINNPKYWQALFYILLGYAKRNLKNKYVPLSKVPKPLSVSQFTEEVLMTNSTPLVSTINDTVRRADPNELGVIKFNQFVRLLLSWNDKVSGISAIDGDRSIPSNFLKSFRRGDQKGEIMNALETFFNGSLFRVEYQSPEDPKTRINYTEARGHTRRTPRYEVVENTWLEDAIEEKLTTSEFKARYLRKSAENSLSSPTRIKDLYNDDVYIVGWKYNHDDDYYSM